MCAALLSQICSASEIHDTTHQEDGMNCTKSQPKFGLSFEFVEADDGNPPAAVDVQRRFSSNDKAQTAIAAWRNLRDVLGELHTLLEEYSPTWYTQRHYERAESALRLANSL